MKKCIGAFAIVFLIACGSAKLLLPTQADADRGAQKFSGLTLAELNEGKSLYEMNCAACHGLKRPASQSEREWNKIVPEMVGKVNKEAGKEVIDAHKQQVILNYLVTMGPDNKQRK